MNKIKTVFLGLLCLLFSLTAPFIVPFALLFTKRDAKNLAWAWYDTPDERDLIGLYEPVINDLYIHRGWWIACYVWFGIRNRGQGFDSLFAVPAKAHWPEGVGDWADGELFISRRKMGPLLFVFGWQIYASNKWGSLLEARPTISVKLRASA